MVLPMQLRLANTGPLLHPSKLLFWTFFGIHKKFVTLVYEFSNHLNGPSQLAFYDFILNTNSRSNVFSAATFYPFWSGIIPDQVAKDEKSAFGVFASLNLVLNRYNGTFPPTFVDSGLQWLAIFALFFC